MDVAGSVALVTGANRGFGKSLCSALLERGAAKVYAGARDVSSVRMDGVEAIQLDITSADDIAAAAAHCGDVTLLVNNAGIGTGTSALSADAIEMAKQEFDTNVLGPLADDPGVRSHPRRQRRRERSSTSCPCCRGSARRRSALYCAAKAASWSLTNAIRQELRSQGTQVVAVHVGFMDTDMTAGLDVPKSSPDDVALQVMDGLEAGDFEVLADDVSRRVRAGLSGDLTVLYPALAR